MGGGYGSGSIPGSNGFKIEVKSIARSLPSDPNKLSKRVWKETSHQNAASLGHRSFFHKDSGIEIRFDRKKDGAPGFRGKNHYHILNPNKTGKSNAYLDKNGNPVARNSDASHILPTR